MMQAECWNAFVTTQLSYTSAITASLCPFWPTYPGRWELRGTDPYSTCGFCLDPDYQLSHSNAGYQCFKPLKFGLDCHIALLTKDFILMAQQIAWTSGPWTTILQADAKKGHRICVHSGNSEFKVSTSSMKDSSHACPHLQRENTISVSQRYFL